VSKFGSIGERFSIPEPRWREVLDPIRSTRHDRENEKRKLGRDVNARAVTVSAANDDLEETGRG
jgi:hypothetical protein